MYSMISKASGYQPRPIALPTVETLVNSTKVKSVRQTTIIRSAHVKSQATINLTKPGSADAQFSQTILGQLTQHLSNWTNSPTKEEIVKNI
ncbi:hypothetical protein VIGAN_01439300 [Vigna angularis var. angularis]|uniref:Uncharacterized protein n=1 Tax=Vigna angularis var. angularis TaxID=157739 RepID=A0A0S3R7G1_PHAAN|nr:hypothetical protein VIGAN_01439300 [Vigna angularis var. angularis]